MPVSPTYPGVYVQEVPSGVKTIAGVATSIGLFLGTSKAGPINQPRRCLNYTAFKNTFGENSSSGQLANYVRLFFLNGGTDCYVMRMAKGASRASVTLKNENSKQVLVLRAKQAGALGENLRAVVTYSPTQPEVTFNLEIYILTPDPTGRLVQQNTEVWRNLSMDPNSPTYAINFITQSSQLVDAELGTDVDTPANPAALKAGPGASISGRQMDLNAAPPADMLSQWTALLTAPAPNRRFRISVDGNPPLEINLTGKITLPVTTATTLATELQKATNDTFIHANLPATKVTVSFPGFVSGPADFARLQIQSAGSGDVFITPAATEDLAVALMLGTAQGGIDISGRAHQRPTANGIVMKGFDPVDTFAATGPGLGTLNNLADLAQSALASVGLEAFISGAAPVLTAVPLAGPFPSPNSSTPPSVVTVAGAKVRTDASVAATSPNGQSDGVREKLQIIAQRINAFLPVLPGQWKWDAEVWGSRLALLPSMPADNSLSPGFNAVGFPAASFTNNVQVYSVGASGNSIGQQISPAVAATDGTPPDLQAYRDAFLMPGGVIDKEVDLFNLMVLAPDAAIPIEKVYSDASVFCQQRRAFLLMDPPTELGKTWPDAQTASTKVPTLRVGLVKDFSAVFYPRLTINDNGLNQTLGPAGAIAGLCARIDGTRGVWKAPAGTEADLRGITGVEQRFSDSENGILNPRAINTIRVFPSGIVNWGARTNYGDNDTPNDYKYIPVRRLALYMEESLYRGLQWVVFEPNDEPLWAQIRLNAGAFMHDLFRQGAFQGTKPADAYFVKCDSETTTQNDRNLGIVNVWVGFAPLKPAEFVILYLQQMAGQIQV
jgi:Bacteriophage tail sheath protein